MVGNCEVGVIVKGPLPKRLKLMVSAPEVALACSMAALKVHWSPETNEFMSHTPSARFSSDASDVWLTVKVVEACVGLADNTTNKLANIASTTSTLK